MLFSLLDIIGPKCPLSISAYCVRTRNCHVMFRELFSLKFRAEHSLSCQNPWVFARYLVCRIFANGYFAEILAAVLARNCSNGFIKCRGTRGSFNNREGQTDSTPVDKYHFTWTKKGVRFTLNLNYKGPLYMNIEGRGV